MVKIWQRIDRLSETNPLDLISDCKKLIGNLGGKWSDPIKLLFAASRDVVKTT